MSSEITKREKDVDELASAQLVTGALRDISARHLETIRKQYERNRDFYGNLSDTYRLVKHEAKKNDISSSSVAPGTNLDVAFTSNKHFYGLLNQEVINNLSKNVSEDSEIFIIGKTGKQYAGNADLDFSRVNFMNFSDDIPSIAEMKKFIRDTKNYESIRFFYNKFENIFTQNVEIENITYRPQKPVEENELTEYFFEPDIPKMLDFFDSQVRFVLFKQVVLDVEVARTAARLMAMSKAENKANNMKKQANKILHEEIISMTTKRILNTYAGINEWNL